MIAALFVQATGVYSRRPDVDAWPEDRDARRYSGPWPVVAHPPCASWGRYAKPTPESRAKGPLLGDDGGCFEAAVRAVRTYGGVLEHPRDSKAWATFGLPVPHPTGWTPALFTPGFVCLVEQGHYGHAAQKPTWLYYVGPNPPDLTWGPSTVAPRPGSSRRGVLECLSKRERAATPAPFADLLINLAHGASNHACRTLDPDSDCPECQIRWAEMVDEMVWAGANVRVTLPPDVSPWFDETAFGACWVGDVHSVNGDSLDVETPSGDVEPVPIEFCRPWRPGTYTTPGAA